MKNSVYGWVLGEIRVRVSKKTVGGLSDSCKWVLSFGAPQSSVVSVIT